ncbi:MAG: molecular chaperone DnaK, partial [Paracoccus sp. (in: a-proteobacteria)]|nr:molecular chaperone DnaK [Paracoccus sp. (in: a-proteobacteria)]
EAIELAIGALEDALKTEDAGKIRGGIQNVMDASMKLGEAIYKAQSDEAEGAAHPDDAPRGVDDDIVDADFEDLGDDKRK